MAAPATEVEDEPEVRSTVHYALAALLIANRAWCEKHGVPVPGDFEEDARVQGLATELRTHYSNGLDLGDPEKVERYFRGVGGSL